MQTKCTGFGVSLLVHCFPDLVVLFPENLIITGNLKSGNFSWRGSHGTAKREIVFMFQPRHQVKNRIFGG